jgi:hypothetical protein
MRTSVSYICCASPSRIVGGFKDGLATQEFLSLCGAWSFFPLAPIGEFAQSYLPTFKFGTGTSIPVRGRINV